MSKHSIKEVLSKTFLPSHMPARNLAFYQLMRVDKPIGTLLLLWPTLWALWFAASGIPSIKNLFIFVTGVILMRSAGCVINDVADRNIDKHVARTQHRPIAKGELTAVDGLVLFTLLCLIALALVLATNPLTIKLSVVGLLLAACYPFAKRYSHLPQVVLGAAFSWSIPMAFAAETATLPTNIWALYVTVVVWTVAYDSFYAMVDREDDLKIGVKSTAILFGDMDLSIIGTLQALAIAGLVITGTNFAMGPFYYLGVAIAALLFYRQQKTAAKRDKTGCFKAFLNNNWVGASIFAGIVAHYLWPAPF